ncbi:MAG: sigma 54-interacting transcriptional regulator [Planctomycetota bacterium]
MTDNERVEPCPPQAVWCLLADSSGSARELLDGLRDRKLGVSVTDGPQPGPGLVILGRQLDALDVLAGTGTMDLGRIAAWAPGAPVEAQREWLGRGLGDFITSPRCTDSCGMIAARVARWFRIDELVLRFRSRVVGDSPALRDALRDAVECGAFGRQPIVLQGDSGVGKELFAKIIHEVDPEYSRGPLRVLDCATVNADLSGSEFFGHERGAFTGAVNERDGAFAEANGGMLFLDEIGELPPRLQAELLRVVQERTFKRVGSNAWQRSTFRLVCATHRDLKTEVAESRFRLDFYFRLAGSTCRIPSLSERPADVLPLAAHFLKLRFGRDAPEMTRAFGTHLLARSYPGNVRELRQLVDGCAMNWPGAGPLDLGCLPRAELACSGRSSAADLPGSIARLVRSGHDLAGIHAEVKRAVYDAIIAEVGEDTARISERLGVHKRTVQLELRDRRPARLSESEQSPGVLA